MTVVSHRKLYLTALCILLVVMVLLVFISVSTVHNLNRERDATMQAAHRQALTLIDTLEAGARAAMAMQPDGWDAIGTLVHEIGQSGDVNYLYLVNASGDVVYHSVPSLEGTRAVWQPEFTRADEAHTRIRRLTDGSIVFEMAKPFYPLGIAARPRSSADADDFPPTTTVYLAIALNAYESARQADIQHAMIMGGIVLALGGGVIYFFVVIRSYYRLSRTLQETRDYARQVIASMVHGVLSIDIDGTVVSFNRQASSLLAIPAAEMDGLDLKTIVDFHRTGIARTLDAGLPVLNWELRFVREHGEALPLLLTVTPIQDESGGRRGAVVVLRDLSELKRLEEQVRRTEKLAAIGRLAAGVAHEIRNPLSSIRGFAYLLGKGHGENTPQREYADVMIREIDRINRVVTDLLNFARPMIPEPVSTAVNALIDHVVSLVSADAEAQQIDIRLSIADDLSPLVLDPNQVTQALLNLLLNAIHSLESGGVITIDVTALDDDRGVIIEVEDDGPGIDPGLQEKIFEPFFTTRERGTGLGLAMVRKIAEIHDGSVRADSPPPGKTAGARFTLVLRIMGPEVSAGTGNPSTQDDPAQFRGDA